MDRDRFDSRVCYLTPRHDLGSQYVEAGFAPVCLNHSGKWHGWRTLVRLVTLIRRHRIDLVHTNHALDRLYLGLAAAICQVPVVTTLHSTSRASDVKRSGLVLARVRTLAALQSWTERLSTRRFIAVSASVRDIGTSDGQVAPDRVSVLYSGIPIDDFRDGDARTQRLREELGLQGAYPVLINVARLTRVKGQISLVQMMPLVVDRWPTVRLLIVGEGRMRPALQEEIRRHGLEQHIALVGQRSDVNDLLALSNLFLFPSVSEGLPLALLEAAAAGKPVVASNCGPMPEVVEDGASGYLVEPGNPEGLAHATLRILESQDRARAMGERARQIAREKFDIQRSVRALERLYLSILEEGRHD
jgi:glycosyltransferase involved in cell wall biosynthesis